MTNKHTPGPWATDKRNPKRVVAPWKDRNISSSRFVATTITVCETEEDASLIAAAPELLEALIAITNQLERVGDTRPHKDGQFIDDARAAIAKATGK